MPQSLSKTLIHIVFSTKHRQHFIDDNIESRIFGYIGQVYNELKYGTIIAGGYRDHVHIFCSLYRPLSQSDLVKEIKINSSKWMKTQGSAYQNFYWQDGYAVFSEGQSDVDGLYNYIKNQRKHHEKETFQEEHRKALHKHDVPFDERYVWD